MKLRALSVVYPAGELIRSGRKSLEVRDWRPENGDCLRDLLIVQNAKWLSSSGLDFDPWGIASALVDVHRVREWKEEDLEAACADDYEPGWYAWELTNIRPVVYLTTIPARLRLYEVELLPELLLPLQPPRG